MIAPGQRFGKLVVVTDCGMRRQNNSLNVHFYRCRCDCGAEKEVRHGQLQSGNSRSCGCARVASVKRRNTTHGLSRSPEYQVWKAMLRRCRNRKCKDFKHYGARGISVCDRWMSFAAFIDDMGRRTTPKHSIDRINVNGNYEPRNCRWATIIEQANNKRKKQ